jgi:cobalamin biosynthesis protein CbiD
MMTYFKASTVDAAHLSELAAEAGAPESLVLAARDAVTARHFFEMCEEACHTGALNLMCRRAREACEAHARGALPVDVVMVDFEGDKVVARA